MAATPTEKIGVCNICEAICGLRITLEGDRVTGVRGNPDDPLSRGHICPKGVSIGDLHHDPDRLRRPVRRDRATDEWHEISWDEALDLVADGIAGAVNQHGRDAVGVYLGNPNAHSLGFATHGIAMVKALRTRNRFSASSVDQIPHQFIASLLFGHQLMIPIPDLDRTSHFLVFGANPMASNGSLMTVPDFPQRLRDLKARGGRMVVVDPRLTETAKVADEHVFVRPGTDAVVLLAMLRELFEIEGAVRPAAYVDGVERVREAVADFTPEHAEAVSGIPAATVRRLTRELVDADGAAAYGRLGLSTQGFGSVCQWAIACLNALTGNLDREGGVLFTEPAIDFVATGLIGRGHFDLYRSRVRDAPEYGGELPVSVMAEEIETPGEGQVRAVLTVAGNPVLSTPNGRRLGEALTGLDFMAAVDIYVNETTRHADVILPPTTILERDHYDIVFHGLAVRNTARFTPAVFDKPRGSRHDWEIFRDLTLRIGERLDHKPPLAARLKLRARLGLSPTFAIGALLRRGRRTTITDLRRTPEGIDLGPLRPTLPDRLRTSRAPDRPGPGGHPRRPRPGPDRAGDRSRGVAADRAAPPARQQLLDAQRRPADPRSPPPPPPHAPRRRRLPLDRRRRDGACRVAGRVGRGRGGADCRRDAGRGLPPPRLRPPDERHPHGRRRGGPRRLDQRPHRPRPPRPLRQRRPQRRPRHRRPGGSPRLRPR